MYFCIKSSNGTQLKLASCKIALKPPVVCSTDRSKAVVPVLCFRFDALTELGAFYANRFFFYVFLFKELHRDPG